MVSRNKIDSLLKVQSDDCNHNLQDMMMSIFEIRLVKFESDLQKARSEISELRRLGDKQTKVWVIKE